MRTLCNVRAHTHNIGNDLIALGMNGVLRRVFGAHTSLVTLPAAGDGGLTGAGLSTRTVYDINQLADGLIVGPGNLLENGGLEVDTQALAALSVPAMLFSVSMGRVFDRRGELVARTDSLSVERTRALCAAADIVLVRDRATLAHLVGLGSDKARLAGCPALFIADEMPPSTPVDLELSDTVLISVRHPRLMSVPNSVQGRVPQDLRRLIDHFRRQGDDVRLLCHDYQDLAFAQAFADVQAMYTEDPHLFLSWLRSCRLNVTFRLHAFLSCLMLGTPSIPISYDERAMSLIETVGFTEWMVCFVHSDDVLAAVQQRGDALPQLEELRQRAQPIWEGLRRAMTEGVEEFADRVEHATSGRRF